MRAEKRRDDAREANDCGSARAARDGVSPGSRRVSAERAAPRDRALVRALRPGLHHGDPRPPRRGLQRPGRHRRRAARAARRLSADRAHRRRLRRDGHQRRLLGGGRGLARATPYRRGGARREARPRVLPDARPRDAAARAALARGGRTRRADGRAARGDALHGRRDDESRVRLRHEHARRAGRADPARSRAALPDDQPPHRAAVSVLASRAAARRPRARPVARRTPGAHRRHGRRDARTRRELGYGRAARAELPRIGGDASAWCARALVAGHLRQRRQPAARR